MMDSLNQQCRVRQCLTCEDNTVFYCFTCKRHLCNSGRTKHLHDLTTTFHETVLYNVEKKKEMDNLFLISFSYGLSHSNVFLRHKQRYSAYNSTIRTIRSEDLFKRRAIMLEIQSDIETFSTEMSSHLIPSKCFTKAQRLCKLIDNFSGCDKDKYALILQLTMKNHIAKIQRYEQRYEESAIKPTKFISFIKTCLSKIDARLNLAQHSHLSFNESIDTKSVIQFLCSDIFTEWGKLRLGNEFYLKLSEPELHQTLTLTDTFGCLHVTHVRPDMFWVSDHRNHLILFDANGNPQSDSNIEVYDDIYLTGAHTVSRNNSLIYIDKNKKIMHFSNGNTYILHKENDKSVWIYRCVYSSLLSGNLLIGMSNKDSTCSKVIQHNIDRNCLGHLVQTVQYDNTGTELYVGPCYITENNNGDIVVSDLKNGVVVTNSEGRHRFTFNQDPSGNVINPNGICTDPMSHILVCVRYKVMMLDKDGVFLSYILSMPLNVMKIANSLSFDFNTHCLWVGSVSEGRVHAFKYLKRPDALLGMYASVL